MMLLLALLLGLKKKSKQLSIYLYRLPEQFTALSKTAGNSRRKREESELVKKKIASDRQKAGAKVVE